METQSYKNFKSLLEIRDFCAKLLSDHKNFKSPSGDFYLKALLKFLKERGYTKINSRKALAFLKDKLIHTNSDSHYMVLIVNTANKKRPGIYAITLKKVEVEGNFYYIGSIKDNPSVMILTPHFFVRYKERTRKASLDDAITDFMGHMLTYTEQIFKVPDSASGEVLVKFSQGVGLAHKTTLGIQGKEVTFYRTFISNEMLTNEQKELIGYEEHTTGNKHDSGVNETLGRD